jgi:hypothetical protein
MIWKQVQDSFLFLCLDRKPEAKEIMYSMGCMRKKGQWDEMKAGARFL